MVKDLADAQPTRRAYLVQHDYGMGCYISPVAPPLETTRARLPGRSRSGTSRLRISSARAMEHDSPKLLFRLACE